MPQDTKGLIEIAGHVPEREQGMYLRAAVKLMREIGRAHV